MSKLLIMHKLKQYLPKIFFNKIFLQIVLACLMLGFGVFFFGHEHLALLQLREKLATAQPLVVGIGILLMFAYIVVQGYMYKFSFKALGVTVPLSANVVLYLKRNLFSVFLPAGSVSSLAFFNSETEAYGVTRSQNYIAATIYTFCGLASVVVAGAPILAYSLLHGTMQTTELIGFLLLVVMLSAAVWFVAALTKKGKLFQWLTARFPAIGNLFQDIFSHDISLMMIGYVLSFSVIIEVIGVAHLYIAMIALGYEASLEAACIGYIVMILVLIASPLLRGLGAVEVSLAFVLQQYGFSLVAATAITLLFRFFEFWLLLVAGAVSFFYKRDHLLLRVLPAIIIFVLGTVNIVSAISPALPARLSFVNNFFSPELITVSTGLVLVFGLVLVLISIFLIRGSRRAWLTALVLTSVSFVGHLIKGADYEEATLALLAGGLLLYTSKNYTLKPHPKFTRISYQVLIFSVLAVLAYAVTGFYFIDKQHFGVDFEFSQAVRATLRMFFLFDDSGVHPLTSFGRNFLYSIYLSGAGVVLFIFYSLLRPYFQKPYNSEEDWQQATQLSKQYGHSALDYFKIYRDKLLFFSDTHDAFLAFKVTRHFAIVLEDPVAASPEAIRDIIAAFEAYCLNNGFVAVYYRVPESSLPIYRSLGKKSFPIGEEAVVNLCAFTLEGKKMKPTRNALNRLQEEGYRMKMYEPPLKEGLLQKLEQVSDAWLASLGQKEIAFTQGIFDKAILKNHTMVTIEDAEERVVAFLNLIPDYAPGEATYDLIRKLEDAPNGVLDMLLTLTFLSLKEKGYTSVNMGLAPMSGIEGVNLTERSVKYAYEHVKAFGHFKGLRKYKEKYFPQWQKKVPCIPKQLPSATNPQGHPQSV